MDKLSVGDKVLILPRIGGPEKYIGHYIDEMLSFENKIAVVSSTISACCKLDIDNMVYLWDSKALLKLDKPVNYHDLSEGETVVFKIGEEYIKGTIKVSPAKNFYIQVECDADKLNKLCCMTVAELTKKFTGNSRSVLIANSKEKLKEMLDFINTLSSTKSTTEFDSNSIDKEPLNQKNYVVKLQRTKASVRRAEVPKGNRVCSKVHKTAISSQSLSYSICAR